MASFGAHCMTFSSICSRTPVGGVQPVDVDRRLVDAGERARSRREVGPEAGRRPRRELLEQRLHRAVLVDEELVAATIRAVDRAQPL
eukprot:2304849-Rhodomonas_salina.1